MPAQEIIEVLTERLLLRGFREEDLPAYHALFIDPEVIRYLPIRPPGLTQDEVEAGYGRVLQHWRTHGFGVWAVTEMGSQDLIGHCGLRYLEDIGETEVLYALDHAHWGRGLATEAAGAALRFGFESVGLERIVAFAVPENRASTRVMEKLGMRSDGEADLFGLHLSRYVITRAELL